MKLNLAETLFPSYCILCKKVGESICASCIRNKIFVNWNTYCCVCNSKVKSGLIHEECKNETYLDGHFFVTSYNEGIKELIMQGKYSFNYSNFVFLGKTMSKFISFYKLDTSAILVPIPLTRKKKRARGFNQSEIMVKEIAKRTKFISISILKKPKDVSAQADLSGEERRINLKDAFQVDSNIIKDLNTSTPILLVDDVFTTGSTLNECAKTLKNFGFNKVYGYTFAKAGKV